MNLTKTPAYLSDIITVFFRLIMMQLYYDKQKSSYFQL